MSDILDISGTYISEMNPAKKQLSGEVRAFDSTKLNRVKSAPVICDHKHDHIPDQKNEEIKDVVIPNYAQHIESILTFQKSIVYRNLQNSKNSGIVIEFKSPINKKLYYNLYKIGYIVKDSTGSTGSLSNSYTYNIYPNESVIMRFIYNIIY